jgi:hypothetical protein
MAFVKVNHEFHRSCMKSELNPVMFSNDSNDEWPQILLKQGYDWYCFHWSGPKSFSALRFSILRFTDRISFSYGSSRSFVIVAQGRLRTEY